MPRTNSKHLTDPGIAKIAVAEARVQAMRIKDQATAGVAPKTDREANDGPPCFGAVAEGDHVFTTTSGRRPVSGFSKMKARTDQLSGVAGWRLHDLRRTARTGLAELGIPQIVVEKVLNHAERNQLVQTYDRHHYAGEKRDALDLWANRLREIVEPPSANVVRLTAER